MSGRNRNTQSFLCTERMDRICEFVLKRPQTPADAPKINQSTSRFFFSGSSGCQTIDGVPCILPFIYEGTSYSLCTAIGDFDGRPWCSTHVDEFGQHKGDENWGYCQTKDSRCGLE